MKNISTAWLVCVALALPGFAQEPAATPMQPDEAGPSLRFQTGDVVLPNQIATLHLGTRYRYLDPEEADKLLMAWGNESDPSTQGAIVPTDVDPTQQDGWAVILTYVDEGHVDDSDAAELDYDDMLKDMKADTEEWNAERKSAGFEPVHLVGWAEPPHYDAATKKLYWAKELNFEGSETHTLNYDVRVLGREGVLSMNAVAGMDQLAQIKAEMRPLIEVADFNAGHRYVEFNKSTDRVAEYGLGALIAGGVAAKLGLFGKLLAFVIAAKKFLIAGVIALGGLVARMFIKKKDSAA